MAERKDKKKVVGEPMTDEQIKVFLDFPPEEGENPDFHVLLKAYRALRAEDFERFVAFLSVPTHRVPTAKCCNSLLSSSLSTSTAPYCWN